MQNSTKIEFSLAQKEHSDDIFKLFCDAIKNLDANNISQWDEIYPDRITIDDDMEKRQMYCGMIDGRIAAVYVLNQECDRQYENGSWMNTDAPYMVIHRLCVDPFFQHQGVGTAVMKHIESVVRSNHIHSIRLDAFTENPFSCRMYEKLGYRKTGFAHWRKGQFFLMEKIID
ncbi:MAG: GNAT family N-acetyltransferase [Treponema sp.]|jgi:GNAT superfamily N-acetyltransferase|nr:GNAT family N-acetyltransferase [Treponema sp.]